MWSLSLRHASLALLGFYNNGILCRSWMWSVGHPIPWTGSPCVFSHGTATRGHLIGSQALTVRTCLLSTCFFIDGGILILPFRLSCLWLTVGQEPWTSPTHRFSATSPKPPTSVCVSWEPTPCWATWWVKPCETPPSLAGWETRLLRKVHGNIAGWGDVSILRGQSIVVCPQKFQ